MIYAYGALVSLVLIGLALIVGALLLGTRHWAYARHIVWILPTLIIVMLICEARAWVLYGE